jgi:hypothetical protein
MESSGFSHLIRWLAMHAMLLTILVTAGVALLLGCCLACSNCSCRDKDNVFRRHAL